MSAPPTDGGLSRSARIVFGLLLAIFAFFLSGSLLNAVGLLGAALSWAGIIGGLYLAVTGLVRLVRARKDTR